MRLDGRVDVIGRSNRWRRSNSAFGEAEDERIRIAAARRWRAICYADAVGAWTSRYEVGCMGVESHAGLLPEEGGGRGSSGDCGMQVGSAKTGVYQTDGRRRQLVNSNRS